MRFILLNDEWHRFITRCIQFDIDPESLKRTIHMGIFLSDWFAEDEKKVDELCKWIKEEKSV